MKEMSILKNYISNLVDIPDDEWKYYVTRFSRISLKAGEFFFRQGETVNQVGFLTNGLLKNFHLYPDGREWIRSFSCENSITADYCALLQKKPALFSCEAIEESVILVISYEDVLRGHSRHPCWQTFDLLNLSQLQVNSENRIYQEVSLSAKERWMDFKAEYAQISERIPRYLIARYLGITPEAFSRISKGPHST